MKCEKCDSEISYGNMLLRRLKRGDLKMTRQEDGEMVELVAWVERMIELEKKHPPVWPIPWTTGEAFTGKREKGPFDPPLQPFNPPQETTPHITPECAPGPTTPDPKYTDHTLSNKNTFKE